MKKIITLLLALALCTAFALPAFAEETKTADDYWSEANRLWSEDKPEESALAYVKAGELYQEAGDSQKAASAYRNAGSAYNYAAIAYEATGDFTAAADMYMKAGSSAIKAGDWNTAATRYDGAALVYKNKLVDLLAAGDMMMLAGACYAKAGDLNRAALTFGNAVSVYKFIGDTEYAEYLKQFSGNTTGFAELDEGSCAAKDYFSAMGYLAKAVIYRQMGDDRSANSALVEINGIFNGLIPGANGNFGGSTLSEGSLTIIVGVAAAVVFGLGGFLLGTAKKKKTVKESEE